MAMATLPEHSRQNRRMQINQAGAWGNMLRFTEGPAVSRQEIKDIEDAAVELACLAEDGTTLRVVDHEGKVLRSWSVEGGWKVAEARS
jgi:hypothetical protein